ncbi:hypothetical protein ASPFODRAFT_503196 [Aspergillus luchuensis CBS 106.47]|uniref:Uncharacterized protein n=1 Tax=Aspergillus luchuensis (strain CBS 106.47) TaxID=1137211 RepID=A0A1M3TS72_ASPLC|nr:hypothetical protein ASPFODRAFT_503196 [Aspergillus luchuensis CBS 106.47]
MVICLLLSRRLRISISSPDAGPANWPILPSGRVISQMQKIKEQTQGTKTKREAGWRGKYGEGRKKKGKEKEKFTEYRHRAAWRKGENLLESVFLNGWCMCVCMSMLCLIFILGVLRFHLY